MNRILLTARSFAGLLIAATAAGGAAHAAEIAVLSAGAHFSNPLASACWAAASKS